MASSDADGGGGAFLVSTARCRFFRAQHATRDTVPDRNLFIILRTRQCSLLCVRLDCTLDGRKQICTRTKRTKQVVKGRWLLVYFFPTVRLCFDATLCVVVFCVTPSHRVYLFLADIVGRRAPSCFGILIMNTSRDVCLGWCCVLLCVLSVA